MTSAVLAGSTGLVGSHILSTLLSTPSITAVHAYSRRELPASAASSTKLHPLTSTDTSTWPSLFPTSSGPLPGSASQPAPGPPALFLSALGTTRAAAGGTAAQRKIDLDLNYALARRAKEAGVSTYVLISSQGASASSSFAYPQMKGELEEKVKALGFAHCVILRPGLIVGDRAESRPAEAVARWVAGAVGRWVGKGAVEGWAQDAGCIARAAVRAGVECLEGEREEGLWVVGQAEIVRLGREE